MQNRVLALNKCLLSFGVNPEQNINSLLDLCFKELKLAGIFYNSQINGISFSAEKWNEKIDPADLDELGNKFFEDIHGKCKPAVNLITNLQDSDCAAISQMISKYNFNSLISASLDNNSAHDDSFYAVYQRDRIPDDEDRKFLTLIGSAIAIENRRRASSEETRASLLEREILFKELLHRVKNNLQVLSSLLYIQSMDLEDEKLVSLFQENTSRIRSMSLVYEKLFKSPDFTNLNFTDYVNSLVTFLIETYSAKNKISQLIEMDEIYLPADTVIPCGLLLHELVTNSLKYAFTKEFIEDAKIIISLKLDQDDIILTVADNGVGIPEGIDLESMPQTLGMKLINLLTSQLYGKINLVRNKGTEYKIIFTNRK